MGTDCPPHQDGSVGAIPRGQHASAHHGAPSSPQVALSQYLEGEACAAKLLPMAGQLNAQFAVRGLTLRVACLNNAAIVRLQEKDWGAAAALCTRALDLALDLEPPDAISRAKALFRRALALTKLGDAPQALRDVREAHRLAPRDGEVLGALRLLELGAEMASRRGAEADEIGSRHGEADEIGSRRGEADEMYCAFTALANPMAASDAAGLGQWAPDTAPEPDTAPVSDTAPVPPAEREVISANRSARAVKSSASSESSEESSASSSGVVADAPAPMATAPMATASTAAPAAASVAAAAPSATPSAAAVATPAAAAAAAPTPAAAAAPTLKTAPSLNTAPTPTAAGVPKTAHDAPKTARRTIKVAWARRWLEVRLVGLACHAGHGECV